MKNTNPDESLCNCHEVNNDQDLVINPYINYSSLSHRNHGRNQNQIQSQNNSNPNHFHHSRQEPIYQNQHEIQNQNSQVYPIYSVVNKQNKNGSKNVRIMLDENYEKNDKFTGETDTETNTETEQVIARNFVMLQNWGVLDPGP